MCMHVFVVELLNRDWPCSIWKQSCADPCTRTKSSASRSVSPSLRPMRLSLVSVFVPCLFAYVSSVSVPLCLCLCSFLCSRVSASAVPLLWPGLYHKHCGFLMRAMHAEAAEATSIPPIQAGRYGHPLSPWTPHREDHRRYLSVVPSARANVCFSFFLPPLPPLPPFYRYVIVIPSQVWC
jgi:hypothetical protein